MRHLAFIFLLTTFSLSCVSKPLDEISLPTTDNVNANNTEKDDDNINDDTINSIINDDTIDEGTPENTTEIKPNGQLIADGNDENNIILSRLQVIIMRPQIIQGSMHRILSDIYNNHTTMNLKSMFLIFGCILIMMMTGDCQV